ncbi:MAG: universal stress protein [Deltaproteobacteria bacterium]|nr:universal stress protein [Deltaproteobacteria bacterium]MBI3078067.1 universal stress protein [Deltaproteobacteria bacterium]
MEAIKLILVPTDLSKAATEAFMYAAAIARQFSAKVLVVHAMAALEPEDLGYPKQTPLYQILEDFERMTIHHFKSTVTETDRVGVPVSAFAARGKAVEVILKAAELNQADLIVMATHGRSGLSHALMGSVTEAVMRQAHCPVLTIRVRPTAFAQPAAA